MIEVQDNIPLPEKRGGRPAIYPLDGMKVGQSFFCETKTQSPAAAVSSAQKRTGFRFATRKVTENGVTGVRVWRIA